MGEKETFLGGEGMIAFITFNEDIKFNMEGIKTLKIKEAESFQLKAVEDYEGLLVDARDVKFALNVVTHIRGASSNRIFLKPVFLYSELSIKDEYLLEITDGQVNSATIMDVFALSRELMKKIAGLPDFQGYKYTQQLVLKTLQLMVSRDKELIPIIMPKSKFGYVYPLVTVNFARRDDQRMFEIVDFIEKEGLADSRFVDRVHLCPTCYSSFINFREVCPRCGSANLSVDDLIHHFPCGYVGPEREFKEGENLICPKCGKVLRHIGMDYDRPSIIYNCEDCNYTFQEPEITGLCFYCEEIHPVESLIKKDIKSFQISQVTVNCAMNGIILSLRDILNATMKVYSNLAFQTILEYEYKRQKRYDVRSSLLYLQFELQGEENMAEEDRQRVLTEIAHVLKSVLRESDAITSIDDSSFAILLQEVSVPQAERVVERLKEGINNFLTANFPELKVKVRVKHLSLEEALENGFWRPERLHHE